MGIAAERLLRLMPNKQNAEDFVDALRFSTSTEDLQMQIEMRCWTTDEMQVLIPLTKALVAQNKFPLGLAAEALKFGRIDDELIRRYFSGEFGSQPFDYVISVALLQEAESQQRPIDQVPTEEDLSLFTHNALDFALIAIRGYLFQNTENSS